MRAACATVLMSLAVAVVGAVAAPAAHACGGGLVTVEGGAGADAQRIFFSVHADHTDVITEVGVPQTSSDYGVLLPVPAEPVLDPQPVDAAELEALDRVTAPRIYVSSGGDGGGCGCPIGSGSAKSNGGGGPGDVTVSQPVNIGPVTAVVLGGGTGDAVAGWLTQNGFVVPAGKQPLIDAYAGAGRFFIAIRRNDSAATGAATSVGVHFTLPGAERSLPLRFAQLGAAPEVAFTVLVAAASTAAPSAPFAALTLADLDAATLRTSGYAQAARQAIAAHGSQAFVIDGAYDAASLAGRIGAGVESLIEPGARITRLTTIVPASALTDDVTFDQTFTGTATGTRYVTGEPAGSGSGPREAGLGLGAVALALVSLVRRRRPPAA